MNEHEKRDRQLIELLNELRVALPGVQVMFAFLLAVPFSNGYRRMSEFQKDVFLVAFLATAVSSALLIAPSAYHRLRFRERDKEHMILLSNRLAIAGSVLLAAAISCTVYLITDVLYGEPYGAVAAALAAVVYASLWYGLALVRAAKAGR